MIVLGMVLGCNLYDPISIFVLYGVSSPYGGLNVPLSHESVIV